jgi:S1-C subfamily serine protease
MRRALRPQASPIPGKRLAGTGSGFVVSPRGHVLTNSHVVDHCDAVSIASSDANALPAELVATDAALDLALLTTPVAGQGVAIFRDGAEPPPASDVAVVGYPSLGRVTIRPILVPGIVYIGAGPPDPNRFAMKIAVHPGNSGGPVLDRGGQVAGVVVAMVNTPAVYAETGRVVSDVGFAIRTSVALKFLREHEVAASLGADRTALKDDELLDRASRFVTQIGCWK